jgi:hypothetical protein
MKNTILKYIFTFTLLYVSASAYTLNLESNTTTLNVGEKVSLTLTETSSDNSTKTLDENVIYIINPSQNGEVNGSVLTALKDGNVTVQAKVGTTLSNTLNLYITWVVNGHVLPPEPNPVVNNATLLGVDVNSNGVRDDVERWIYEEYKDKHPIHIDIAMQAARGYKLVIQKQPKTKSEAMSIMKEVEKAVYCEAYYKYDAEFLNEPLLITKNIDSRDFRHKIYFNTQERINSYIQYDTLLSGDSYTLPSFEEEKEACSFNIKKYED